MGEARAVESEGSQNGFLDSEFDYFVDFVDAFASEFGVGVGGDGLREGEEGG